VCPGSLRNKNLRFSTSNTDTVAVAVAAVVVAAVAVAAVVVAAVALRSGREIHLQQLLLTHPLLCCWCYYCYYYYYHSYSHCYYLIHQ